ncbi:hypothetical protein BaRGS_00005787 [Batillaria attramentaria]|uniref:Uncharacterized protein n=1 Tax=Batillaria attramentaria TaxID=370345 RepID=A0ABD0LVP6_9CAEN
MTPAGIQACPPETSSLKALSAHTAEPWRQLIRAAIDRVSPDSSLAGKRSSFAEYQVLTDTPANQLKQWSQEHRSTKHSFSPSTREQSPNKHFLQVNPGYAENFLHHHSPSQTLESQEGVNRVGLPHPSPGDKAIRTAGNLMDLVVCSTLHVNVPSLKQGNILIDTRNRSY